MSTSPKPPYPTPMADPGTTRIGLAQFYGEMIDLHLRQHPEHQSPKLHLIPAALDIGEREFRLGLDWCIERGIIKPIPLVLPRFPDGFRIGGLGVTHPMLKVDETEPEPTGIELPITRKQLAMLVFGALFGPFVLGYFSAISGDGVLIAVGGAALLSSLIAALTFILENGFLK
jgi:hypothetical protein